MRGRLFSVAAAGSTAMLLALGVLWARSYAAVETAEVFWGVRPHATHPSQPAASAVRFEQGRGRVRLWYVAETTLPQEFRAGPPGRWWHVRHGKDRQLGLFLSFSSGPPRGAVLGIHYRTFALGGVPNRIVWVPHAVIAGVLGLLPACWIAARLRRRKRVGGRCVNCGYDLRCSPTRCPECGTSVADLAVANRSRVPACRAAGRT